MSMPFKKAPPATAVLTPPRKVLSPPVFRPTGPLLQAWKAAPAAAPARPVVAPMFHPPPVPPTQAAWRPLPAMPAVFRPQASGALQAKRAPWTAPLKPASSALIQCAARKVDDVRARLRRKLETQQAMAPAAHALQAPVPVILSIAQIDRMTKEEKKSAVRRDEARAELDRDEKPLASNPSAATSMGPPTTTAAKKAAKKGAAKTAAAASAALATEKARLLAAEQVAASALDNAVAHWGEFINGSAAVLFGLLTDGYVTLAPPHRCFLSAHEKQGNERHGKRFGLSLKIVLTDALAKKYFEKIGTRPALHVLHLHCDGDGTVRSLGVKPYNAEGLPGYNIPVPEMYLRRAAAFTAGFNGDNVETKVKPFD